jgi:hypothetical protein
MCWVGLLSLKLYKVVLQKGIDIFLTSKVNIFVLLYISMYFTF